LVCAASAQSMQL